MPNSSSSSTGMVTICMDKQKYSAAAGFHIQLFHFPPAPVPRQGHSRKASKSDGSIPQATSWTAQSYSSFQRGFSSYCLCRMLHPSLSLLSFLLLPVIHLTFWKQIEKGASSCRKGTYHGDFVLPLTVITAAAAA